MEDRPMNTSTLTFDEACDLVVATLNPEDFTSYLDFETAANTLTSTQGFAPWDGCFIRILEEDEIWGAHSDPWPDFRG